MQGSAQYSKCRWCLRVIRKLSLPLVAYIAHDDSGRIVDAAVLARMLRQLLTTIERLILLLELQLRDGIRYVRDLRAQL